jgi:predicted nucleic acid-binding protein
MKTRSKVFIDTNVLVYGVDHSNPTKHGISRDAVNQIYKDRNGVLSTQVMKEFFIVSTKKLGLDPLRAKELTLTLNAFEIVSTDPGLIEEAMDLSILNTLPFWDSLIVAAARRAKCARILSEDIADKTSIAGVLVENPFRV